MIRFFKDKRARKTCHIYGMLAQSAHKKHLSFHTPGHKLAGWDITELSYSDNLSAPTGCIARAERDVAQILGAKRSFLLTDGSTAGVFSLLYAAKRTGARKIFLVGDCHKSVLNGCKLLELTPLLCREAEDLLPTPKTMEALLAAYPALLAQADALLFTSPNYYGKIADLAGARAYCDRTHKLLLVDGAHGGHLHFEPALYAGTHADLWVDGVHKSLPALTQGAVVSARSEALGEALYEGVQIFRTTSPSYPIMASVEYAVKYPRNVALENAARTLQSERIRIHEDWTKVCALFGKHAFAAQKELESRGLYPEFCDGNVVVFYLSPATPRAAIRRLKKALEGLFICYPYEHENSAQRNPAPLVCSPNGKTAWVSLDVAAGRICAADCGLFPPCTPLIVVGEPVEQEKIELLRSASHVFGLSDGKILVYEEEYGTR